MVRGFYLAVFLLLKAICPRVIARSPTNQVFLSAVNIACRLVKTAKIPAGGAFAAK